MGRTTPPLHPPPPFVACGSPGAQAAGGRTQRRQPQSLTFAFGRGEGSRGWGERQAGRPARLLSTAWATRCPSLHSVQPATGATRVHSARQVWNPLQESSALPHEGCASSAPLCVWPPPGMETRHTDDERMQRASSWCPWLFWVWQVFSRQVCTHYRESHSSLLNASIQPYTLTCGPFLSPWMGVKLGSTFL